MYVWHIALVLGLVQAKRGNNMGWAGLGRDGSRIWLVGGDIEKEAPVLGESGFFASCRFAKGAERDAGTGGCDFENRGPFPGSEK